MKSPLRNTEPPKNWRKIYETKTVIYYKKGNKQLVIENVFEKKMIWRIDLFDTNYNFLKSIKKTKTKPQAMVFANRYMKKH